MSKKFYYKQTDSEMVLKVSANLTGSTVRVQLRVQGASTPLPDMDATVTDAAKGIITVDIHDLAIGVYELEIEQNQLGKLAHYPKVGFDLVIIGADLDP